MKSNEMTLAAKFCVQAFHNLAVLLKSRRIGCFICGYLFIYDGTQETEPMTLDGNCGMCPVCSNFSLFGDAAGDFTRAELFECSAYLENLRSESLQTLPPAIRLFLECTANTGKLRQCDQLSCLYCGRIIIPDPVMFYSITGEAMPDNDTFVCPYCLAPLVVPAENNNLIKKKHLV